MEHGFGMSGHPGLKKERHLKESFMSQPIYTQEYVESIKPISIKPEKVTGCRHWCGGCGRGVTLVWWVWGA